MPQNDSKLESTKPRLLASVHLDAHQDIIDPALAPLKHLTDVLGDFKDEHGTYTRLLAHEERDNLLKCLLDEGLVQNSPFQAAMALSLLSKLGFEWDY
ncbi:hypothetical protein BJ912DRAFT_194064 [Pholiota molesta]|nr:hypothetical protein BJ912DRAFT_194064 [Pholiota molesta]